MGVGGTQRSKSSGVVRENGAVHAFFRQHVEPDRQPVLHSEIIHVYVAGGEPQIRLPVDRAADVIGHDVVAVRCEAARMDRQTPPTPEIGIGARHIMRVFVAAEIVKEKMIVLLGRGKNRDSAAHRAIAEQAGRCAAIDFDAAYVGRIDTVPIDPAAERIIQRDAVPENQRPAGARGAGSAKRNTLRSGICDNAGGAAEQAEPGTCRRRSSSSFPGMVWSWSCPSTVIAAGAWLERVAL